MNVKTRDAGLVQDAGSREKKLSQGIKNINWTGVAFIAPSVVVMVALLFYPLGSSVRYSMTNKNLIKAHYELVGLDNFTQLLMDPTFWQAFVTSIKWTALSIVGQLAPGFILTMALNRIRRFSALFRTLLVIPWAFPAVIIGFDWKWILNDVYGVVPNALADTGLIDGLVALLASPKAAFWMVLYVNVWSGTPLFMVNIPSALKIVPGDQIGAVIVDGVSTWKRFYYITLPHIHTVIGLPVVLRTIWVFSNFDLLFLIAGGGSGDATMTLPMSAYRTGWGLKQLGMASAVTILLLVFLILVASILFRFITYWEKETN